MITIRRLIYREVIAAVAFVALGFLALFFFFDFVDELPNVTRGGDYHLTHAMLFVLLQVPNHLYELLPIAVLIGTIFVMARLAQSSEYTILRTSGLGPGRALRSLLGLGVVFTLLTFAAGDYAAPAADRAAQLLKARMQGKLSIGQTGAWLKERQPQRTYTVNVAALTPEGQMQGVRIFESDLRGFMVSMVQAQNAEFGPDAWILRDVERIDFGATASGTAVAAGARQARVTWPTAISPEMVSVALPFAYLHFRSGGITAFVFGGVLIGISFFLLNNVFGYIGNLGNWLPWLTAAAPGLIYSVLSLGAFGWLVLRR